MYGSGTPINMPDWTVEHLKAESRGATWCGERYDVLTSRATPRSGKPECFECGAIERGAAPSKAPPPVSDLFR